MVIGKTEPEIQYMPSPQVESSFLQTLNVTLQKPNVIL
jgi:hypothetical protein